MTARADLQYESALRAQGYRQIAGLDEAGRGAWAGPVAAGAVILPLDCADLAAQLAGVNDSKLLSPRRREKLVPRIMEIALSCAVGFASQDEIDGLGIVPATRLAMQRALDQLRLAPDYLLTDSIRLPDNPLPYTPLIKGDQKSLSIAAASILAKVRRDQVMRDLDAVYPDYYFGVHKGYGTALHRQALDQFGPCAVHRQSFAPIRRWLSMPKREESG